MKKIFIIIIFILLIIPLFNISKEKVSTSEIRVLNKFPQIYNYEDENFNTNFGLNFNDWFSDHFGYRKILIKYRYQFLYRINDKIENEKAFLGRNGWMFDKTFMDYVIPISEQKKQISETIDLFKKLNMYLNNKNASLYIVFIPERNKVLERFWGRKILRKSNLDFADSVIQGLKDTNIRFIYPYDAVYDESFRKNVYFKNDVHLTGQGSYIIANEVFKQIKKDYFPNSNFKLKPLMKNVCIDPGSINAKLNLDRMYCDTYREIEFSSDKKLSYKSNTTIQGGLANGIYISGSSSTALVNKKIYIIGGCYAVDAIYPLLKYVFKESDVYKTTGAKYYPKLRQEQVNRLPNSINFATKNDVFMLVINASYINPEDDTLNILSDSLKTLY